MFLFFRIRKNLSKTNLYVSYEKKNAFARLILQIKFPVGFDLTEVFYKGYVAKPSGHSQFWRFDLSPQYVFHPGSTLHCNMRLNDFQPHSSVYFVPPFDTATVAVGNKPDAAQSAPGCWCRKVGGVSVGDR